jgi:thioredoxin 1
MKRCFGDKEEKVPTAELMSAIGTGPVCIKFTANWCGPCKRIHPHYQQCISQTKSPAQFLVVDIDTVKQLSGVFEIQNLPTFVFLRDGVEFTRMEGGDPVKLKNMIDAFDKTNQELAAPNQSENTAPPTQVLMEDADPQPAVQSIPPIV